MNHGALAIAVAILCAAWPAAAAPAQARIVGTLFFRERDRTLTPAEAERILHGKRISLAFRNGWDVVPSRLERDGRFAADVGPGAWRLEWIDVGERAEVLSTPLLFDARPGAPTCAGRIEVAYADLESELGASAAGTVRVEAGCDDRAPAPDAARSTAGAFAPEVYHPPFGVEQILEGVRAEAFFVEQEPGLRLSWAVPIRRPVAWIGNIVATGAASRLFASDGERDAIDVGAGFAPYWGAELAGGVRWERGAAARGAAPWAGVRLGPPAYAFTARADFRDGVTWSFGLDVSAFHLLGRFL